MKWTVKWNFAHITTCVYKSPNSRRALSSRLYDQLEDGYDVLIPKRNTTVISERSRRRRKQLFRVLNGDAFFPEKSWPNDIRLMFWKKPIGDKETFKLLLSFHDNGCNPEIISRWILLAQSWASSQPTAEKRVRQIQFVIDNVDRKKRGWLIERGIYIIIIARYYLV